MGEGGSELEGTGEQAMGEGGSELERTGERAGASRVNGMLY